MWIREKSERATVLWSGINRQGTKCGEMSRLRAGSTTVDRATIARRQTTRGLDDILRGADRASFRLSAHFPHIVQSYNLRSRLFILPENVAVTRREDPTPKVALTQLIPLFNLRKTQEFGVSISSRTSRIRSGLPLIAHSQV
jgi:hypothetical protein